MNPLQKAAVRRKAFYFAAILALFTVSIFYRGLEAKSPDGTSSYVWIPLGRDDRSASAPDTAARTTILSQARRLELRELDEGDPEIAGEAVRLGLVGSRGFAVTFLWYAAIEKQKRNDFHEFERLVKAVTTLQPHFITPWIFQSWNIAYNVSVEMQSLGDMYFYIARGIDLLAEGERRNRRSPDMRYQIAFYYQNKFGVSDQVETLRCLFSLSCIPPDQRNPDALLNPDESVNLEAFKKFCQEQPMLVRRLRGRDRLDESTDRTKATGASLYTQKPEGVVQFLRDNKNLPSRYRNATELKAAEQQFPALPPQFDAGPQEANPRSSAADLTQAFSGYLAARAWFEYANTIVPPNEKDKEGNPIPSSAPIEYDQFKYRLPRLPVLILFRQGPPRAQTYQAEMMQKDGWFDSEGWEVDAGVSDSNAWFVETVGGAKRKPVVPVVIGAGLPWSLLEWQKSFTRWSKHGTDYGLLLRPNQLERYRADAGVAAGADYVAMPSPATAEQFANEAFSRRYDAQAALYYFMSNRNLTNFPFYLSICEGEQQKATVEARKTLWKAGQERRFGNAVEAAKLYQSGIEQWKKVLANNPTFHHSERLSRIEEDTYDYQADYLRLLASNDPFNEVRKKALEDYRKEFEQNTKLAAYVVPFTIPGPMPKEIPLAIRDARYAATAEKYYAPFNGNVTSKDVPPGDTRIGTPWISGGVREAMRQRDGVSTAKAPPAAPPSQLTP